MSSPKQRLLDAFFNQFSAFLDEVCRIYPDQTEFRAYYTILKLMRTTNPMMVIAEFRRNVGQYETELRKKDDSFFLAQSYDSETGGSSSLNDFINIIKSLWKEATPQVKTSIMDYVNLLLDIANHYYTI